MPDTIEREGTLQAVAVVETRVWNHMFRDVGHWLRVRRRARAVLVLGGAAVAGAAQLPIPLGDGWKMGVGLAGVTAALFGGLLDLAFGNRETALLEEAKGLVDSWKSAVARWTLYEHEVARLRAASEIEHALNVGFDTIIQVLEKLLAEGELSLDQRLDTFVNVGARQLVGPMGLGGAHEWTISVFRRHEIEGEAYMVRVASNWADREEEKRDTRRWRYGKGWTGTAWRDGEEGKVDPYVVEVDTSTPRARRQYDNDDQTQETDYVRFLSVASIPFRVAGDPKVFGVLTATSSRAGAFDIRTDKPGRRNLDTMKSFALLAAALVAAHQ